MALDNATVLENLRKQKTELETQIESAREMYLKVLGAIDVLEQIEKENAKKRAEYMKELKKKEGFDTAKKDDMNMQKGKCNGNYRFQ